MTTFKEYLIQEAASEWTDNDSGVTYPEEEEIGGRRGPPRSATPQFQDIDPNADEHSFRKSRAARRKSNRDAEMDRSMTDASMRRGERGGSRLDRDEERLEHQMMHGTEEEESWQERERDMEVDFMPLVRKQKRPGVRDKLRSHLKQHDRESPAQTMIPYDDEDGNLVHGVSSKRYRQKQNREYRTVNGRPFYDEEMEAKEPGRQDRRMRKVFHGNSGDGKSMPSKHRSDQQTNRSIKNSIGYSSLADLLNNEEEMESDMPARRDRKSKQDKQGNWDFNNHYGAAAPSADRQVQQANRNMRGRGGLNHKNKNGMTANEFVRDKFGK